MYIIRAWDYDYIFGYVSKIMKNGFILDDSVYSLRFKTKTDAENTIKALKTTGTKLNFCPVEIVKY